MASRGPVDDVSKSFRLYHERASSLKERVVNRRRAAYEEFWALKDVSLEIEHVRDRRPDRPERVGEDDAAEDSSPGSSGRRRDASRRAGASRRSSSWGPGSTPTSPDARTSTSTRRSSGCRARRRTSTSTRSSRSPSSSTFIDMQVRHYSSGMYVRLGFAVAVHVDPEILIVDEVLAVGDEAFQRRCLGRIRDFQREGRTIVFVTHAVDIVREICTKAFFLEKGSSSREGRPSDVVDTFRRHIHGGDPDADRRGGRAGDGRGHAIATSGSSTTAARSGRCTTRASRWRSARGSTSTRSARRPGGRRDRLRRRRPVPVGDEHRPARRRPRDDRRHAHRPRADPGAARARTRPAP